MSKHTASNRNTNNGFRLVQRPGFPSGRWGLERFLDEAQVLAGFDHAHINRVHRRFQAHGTAYLVLEYVSGETLSERLRHTKVLAPAEALRLFKEALNEPILDSSRPLVPDAALPPASMQARARKVKNAISTLLQNQ